MMARAAGALLRAERATFSAALAHQLPEPDRAAAATLYFLYGQRLKPFLEKGALFVELRLTVGDGLSVPLVSASCHAPQFKKRGAFDSPTAES